MRPRSRPRRIGIWAGPIRSFEANRARHELVRRLADAVDCEYVWLHGIQYRFGTVTFCWSCHEGGDVDRAASTEEPSGDRCGRAAEFSAVLSFDYRDEVWSWPLAQLGIKTVCVVSDLLPFRASGAPDAGERFKAFLRMAGQAAAIICPSKATSSALESAISVARRKVHAVLAGSDAAPPGPLRARDLLDQNAAETVATILTFDTGAEGHAHVLLAAAPGIARLLGPKRCRIVFAGEGEVTGRYLVDRHGPLLERARADADLVFKTVAASNVGPLVRAADVVVQLGCADGFGLSLLDAMHAGTLAVTADGPSFAEIGGGRALACNIYDTDGVATTVAAALTVSGRRRAQISGRALRWAAGLTWAQSAAAFQQILEDVVRSGAPAGSPRAPSREQKRCPSAREPCDPSTYEEAYVVRLEDLGHDGNPSSSALLELVRTSPLRADRRRALVVLADVDLPNFDVRPATIVCAAIRADHPGLDVRLIFCGSPPLDDPRSREAAGLIVDLVEAEPGIGHALATPGSFPHDPLECTTAYLADASLIGRVEAVRSIVLGPADHVVAPLRAIGDETLRGLIVAQASLQSRADRFCLKIDRYGSLGALIGSIEQTTGGPAAAARDAGRPWHRHPFDELEDGLLCLMLPGLLSDEGATAVDASSPDANAVPEVICVPFSTGAGRPVRYRFRLRKQESVEALCFAARCVVGRVETDGRLCPELLLAIRLGKPVLLIGTASHPNLRLFPNVSQAPHHDDTLLERWSSGTEHKLELAPDRQLLPAYPPSFGLLLSLANVLREGRPLAQSDREDLRQLDAVPEVQSWIAYLKRSEVTNTIGDELSELLAGARFGRIPAAVPSAREAAGARGDDLATRLDACGGSEAWSDVARAWSTGATEQVGRLYRERSFTAVVICGESGQDTQIRCFDDFDASFLDACVDEDIPIIFAGGVGAVPVPGSRFFVTGPVATVRPALTASCFGLIPRLRPSLGGHKQLRLASCLRAAGMVTFCPAELLPQIRAEWGNPSGQLVPFGAVSDLRIYFSADPARKSDRSAPPSLMDFEETAAISTALSYATSSLWRRTLYLHRGVSGVDRLALSEWRRLKQPSRLRQVTIRLPGLSDPQNQSLGLCSGFYDVETDPGGRAFRWLGPSDAGAIRLPATAATEARLELRIIRMGACSEKDISVLVQGREVPLRWTRESDDFVVASEPCRLVRGRLIEVTVQARSSFQPGGRDARVLRIAISDLTITIGTRLGVRHRASPSA